MERIKVINLDTRKEWLVWAELVRDYNLTNAYERVAWNGTLLLYVDKKGQHYLWHHTGNSAHRGIAVEVPAHVKNLSKLEALEWIV